MGQWTTITLKGKVERFHVCYGCGHTYSYLMERATGYAGGRPPPSYALEAALRERLKEDCDQVPCPACGLFQPEMVIAARRGPSDPVSENFGQALFGALFIAVLLACDRWPWFVALSWFVGLGGLAHHLCEQAAFNPNANVGATRNGRPVPGAEPADLPARLAMRNAATLALVVALLGIGLHLGLTYTTSIDRQAGFPQVFFPPVSPPVFGPGSNLTLLRNALTSGAQISTLGGKFATLSASSRLIYSDGREIPLTVLPPPPPTEGQESSISVPSPAQDLLDLEDREIQVLTDQNNHWCTPQLALQIPGDAPGQTNAILEVTWEIGSLAKKSTLTSGPRIGLTRETLNGRLLVSLGGASAEIWDQGLRWLRLALLVLSFVATTRVGTFFAAAAYDPVLALVPHLRRP